MDENTLTKFDLDQIQRGCLRLYLLNIGNFWALSRKQICTSLTRSLQEWFPSSRCDFSHYKALRKDPSCSTSWKEDTLQPLSAHPQSRTPVKPTPVESPQFPCRDKAKPVPSISQRGYIDKTCLIAIAIFQPFVWLFLAHKPPQVPLPGRLSHGLSVPWSRWINAGTTDGVSKLSPG